MILAGDIGGTRARFALYEGGRAVRKETLESRTFKSMEAALRAFLGPRPARIDAACLGIAGPVIDQRCQATNLPWTIDARAVARKFGIERVELLNDLVALALGAVIAPARKLRSLSGGALPRKRGANLAILAAGTGLGQAALVWSGERFVALATEGGHADFAPRSEEEEDLLEYLRGRYGRVTYERVLSGPGIGNVYDFFRDCRGVTESADVARAISEAADRNAVITKLGLSGRSDAARRALELFVAVYGAEAGNLALRTFALGGVFVAGGIAGALADQLAAGAFQRAMHDKAPMGDLVANIPVALVLDSTIGLKGAAHHAAQIAR